MAVLHGGQLSAAKAHRFPRLLRFFCSACNTAGWGTTGQAIRKRAMTDLAMTSTATTRTVSTGRCVQLLLLTLQGQQTLYLRLVLHLAY